MPARPPLAAEGLDIRLGVNLSPSQFQSGDLAATVEAVLCDTGFSPSLLELEVTEDILLDDDERACGIFRRIQDLGVSIAFDDFGTGYASLTYLKKFPLDRLKIDKSFVRDLRAGSDDVAIVGATISLGKLLGLSVIAEGIEDRATADLLRSMGCEEGQGYYFGRPMPAAEFEEVPVEGRSSGVRHVCDATGRYCGLTCFSNAPISVEPFNSAALGFVRSSHRWNPVSVIGVLRADEDEKHEIATRRADCVGRLRRTRHRVLSEIFLLDGQHLPSAASRRRPKPAGDARGLWHCRHSDRRG